MVGLLSVGWPFEYRPALFPYQITGMFDYILSRSAGGLLSVWTCCCCR